MSTTTIKIQAKRYADHDDSLNAAAEDYARTYGLAGWDLSPRWEDEQRNMILIDVPANYGVTDDQIDQLRDGAGGAGDLEMCAICSVALAEEMPDVQRAALAESRKFATATRDQARAECARVIEYARTERAARK